MTHHIHPIPPLNNVSVNLHETKGTAGKGGAAISIPMTEILDPEAKNQKTPMPTPIPGQGPLPGLLNGRIKVSYWSRGKILTIYHLVFAYAILYLMVKAFQFGKDIKLSVDILIAYAKSPSSFQQVLHDKASKVLWMGSSVPMALNIPAAVAATHTLHHGQPISKEVVLDHTQFKMDVHVWTSFLFLQGLEYLFAWLLVFSIKGKVALGVIAWLTFSIPVFFLYFLQVVTDALLADYFGKGLIIQADQCIELMLQAATMLMALVYIKFYSFPQHGAGGFPFGAGRQFFQGALAPPNAPAPVNVPAQDNVVQINLPASRNPVLIL